MTDRDRIISRVKEEANKAYRMEKMLKRDEPDTWLTGNYAGRASALYELLGWIKENI